MLLLFPSFRHFTNFAARDYIFVGKLSAVPEIWRKICLHKPADEATKVDKFIQLLAQSVFANLLPSSQQRLLIADTIR